MTLAAIQEMASLQGRVLDAWADFSLLSQRFYAAPSSEQPSLRAAFDELSVRMLANAESVRSLLIRYHRPE
jgi:hypothetical protein